MTPPAQREGSASIDQPDYWWYTARSALLEAALGDQLGLQQGRQIGRAHV